MATWDLAPPNEAPILTRDEAIEIALSDPMTSPELRGLPVDAEYGSPLHFEFRGARPDVWKVSIDVSGLGCDMAYEGPGPTRIDGKMHFPSHVQVPKVLAVVIIVDDKMRRRALSLSAVSGTDLQR
jgi:hypothetical protein